MPRSVRRYVVIKAIVEVPDDVPADEVDEYADEVLDDMDYNLQSSNALLPPDHPHAASNRNLITSTEVVGYQENNPL